MKLDLTGQRFGRLTVIEEAETDEKYKVKWLCKCDCGNYKVVSTLNLRREATRSCGCLKSECVKNQAQMYPKDVRIKRLRHIWHGMIRRCSDKNYKYYYCYGERGIKVCDEWKNYVVFARWALNNGYADTLTIDRINNDGDYEPSNCRWVTIKQQRMNTSRNKYATINGVKKTITEWAEEYGMKPNTVFERVRKGTDILAALERVPHGGDGRGKPVRCVDTGEEFENISAVNKKYGYSISCISSAVRKGTKSYGMKWEYVYD